MPRPRREGSFTYCHRPFDRLWMWGLSCVAIGVFAAAVLWNENTFLALAVGFVAATLPLLRLLFVRFELFTVDAGGLTIRSATPLGWFARETFYAAAEIRRVRYRIILHEVRSDSTYSDEEWHHLELHMMQGTPSRIEILQSRVVPLPKALGRQLADHLGVEYVETHEPTP